MSTSIQELSIELSRLRDERQILNLLHEYGHRVDFSPPEDWVALFTEDGAFELQSAFANVLGLSVGVPFEQQLIDRGGVRIDQGYRFQGHAALRAFVGEVDRSQRQFHLVGQPRVNFQHDDLVEVRSYMLVLGHRHGEAPQLLCFGRYIDTLVRTAAGWRFQRRVCEI